MKDFVDCMFFHGCQIPPVTAPDDRPTEGARRRGRRTDSRRRSSRKEPETQGERWEDDVVGVGGGVHGQKIIPHRRSGLKDESQEPLSLSLGSHKVDLQSWDC